MATNFEFYKDEILEITQKDKNFAKINGKMVPCYTADCWRCDFGDRCLENKYEWLYAEHIEPPKLTKRERAFCEIIEDGSIVRDYGGALFVFERRCEAVKKNGQWMEESAFYNHIPIDSDYFSFITREDEKPWAIEDLLKLEVEE